MDRNRLTRAKKVEAKSSDIGNRKRKQASSASTRKAATKSRYFKSDTEDDDKEASEEDDASSAIVDDENDSDESEEPSSEEEQPRKRRAPTTKTQSAPFSGSKGNELWRQGVKTGLEPGTQVVIKKPKPRTAGSTPYADDTIHQNTMLFLKDLKANNDREWLKSKWLSISFASSLVCLFSVSRPGFQQALSLVDSPHQGVVLCRPTPDRCMFAYAASTPHNILYTPYNYMIRCPFGRSHLSGCWKVMLNRSRIGALACSKTNNKM